MDGRSNTLTIHNSVFHQVHTGVQILRSSNTVRVVDTQFRNSSYIDTADEDPSGIRVLADNDLEFERVTFENLHTTEDGAGECASCT